MKRLAAIAALVAVFAIPAMTSGGLFDYTDPDSSPGVTYVEEGTIAVECRSWTYGYETTDSGLELGPRGLHGRLDADLSEVIDALGKVKVAVEEAIEDIEMPRIEDMYCVDWETFVIR